MNVVEGRSVIPYQAIRAQLSQGVLCLRQFTQTELRSTSYQHSIEDT